MPRAVKEMLRNGYSVDETDRTPENIHVSRLDVFMYGWAIVGHLVDVAVDCNIAVSVSPDDVSLRRYFLGGLLQEFLWTLAFILVPAFINTAISARMYSQDKSREDSMSNTFSKVKLLRIFVLVFQMAPILRFTDALICALESRRAELRRDPASQRRYYRLMLKEDADAALLRAVECFLEAAPQQALQLTFLYRGLEEYTVHQMLSIVSSVISMGWCLAAYQRAVRFAQEDKRNMSWCGTALQILWHFLVTLSRIVAISMIATLHPHWTVFACALHVLVMAAWLQCFDRSPFCSHNKLAEIAFSFVMGAIYIFTYIIPVEGRTRYRYAAYYTVCFVENLVCAALWYLMAGGGFYFYPVLVLSVVPFVVGLVFMVVYYACFHPKKMDTVTDGFVVTFKTGDETTELS